MSSSATAALSFPRFVNFARPKSPSFSTAWLSKKMFSGFRSPAATNHKVWLGSVAG